MDCSCKLQLSQQFKIVYPVPVTADLPDLEPSGMGIHSWQPTSTPVLAYKQ